MECDNESVKRSAPQNLSLTELVFFPLQLVLVYVHAYLFPYLAALLQPNILSLHSRTYAHSRQ